VNNQQKLVVVILVILGLLFFLGLGAGFRFNASKKDKPSPASENPGSGLMGVMDEWLAPFGPKLDLSGVYCNNQPVTQTFLLNQALPECVLRFPDPANKDRSRKASLRVLGDSGLPVYFAYEKPKPESEEPPVPCPVAPDTSPGLKLLYKEEGTPEFQASDRPPRVCWSKKDAGKPIRVLALKRDASLRLLCEACKTGERQAVALRFEFE